jgi:hypothetical protein
VLNHIEDHLNDGWELVAGVPDLDSKGYNIAFKRRKP